MAAGVAYVTMEDVAREAGCRARWCRWSCATATRCPTSAARACWRRRARLGYRPNAIARSLASHRTHTVGVLLNDLHNPFFAEIANGIEDLASELGYRLLIITGGRREQRERAMLEALLEYRTDGLILVSPRMAGPQLAAAVGRCRAWSSAAACATRPIDCVMTDEARGRRPGRRAPGRARARADRPRRRRPGRRRARRARTGYMRAMDGGRARARTRG